MIVRRSSFELGAQMGALEFTVLVADDSAVNRRLFETLYKSCGCAVTLAADGFEALSAALSKHFDLICLDRHMPHVSGDEVSDVIRTAYGRSPRPYLVLCTSDPRPGDPAHGFDAILPKPVTPQDVVDVVGKALQWGRAVTERSRNWAVGDRGEVGTR
jgi:CheY-like chemotaxis protein